MDLEPLKANAGVLAREMQWLALVIDTRMKLYFSQDSEYTDIYNIPLPEFAADDSVYGTPLVTPKIIGKYIIEHDIGEGNHDIYCKSP